jgi:L-seryl-tRNA(Ser) seleniumtransferase
MRENTTSANANKAIKEPAIMKNESIPLQDMLRRIPGVDDLLLCADLQQEIGRHPRKLVLESIRQVLEAKRRRIMAEPERAEQVNLDSAHLVELIRERLETLGEHTLQPVVNATGIVIHTNLGRSLLPAEAIQRLELLSRSYNNLEYDLAQGRRGSRYVHAEAILCEITGADTALVVNNNAGAVLLVLNSLARDREVIVSRGQLVEIGGSFRIPDVMASSGARLREVGCTNRTHLRDYEMAIGEQTALLMKVHTSNYRMIGFTAEVSLEELVELGRKHNLPVVEDLGSGSFVDFSRFGLYQEPTAQETIRKGAAVVTFSGDKLLGGPQAGIILGRRDLIERCKKNPMTRALRVDKLTLAALEATLRLYRDEAQALEKIPTLKMIAAPLALLEARANKLAARLQGLDAEHRLIFRVQAGFSQVGGGSLPGQDLPTMLIAVSSKTMSTQAIEQQLRRRKPPIIGRIESNQFLMDVRTLQEGDDAIIEKTFAEIFF